MAESKQMITVEGKVADTSDDTRLMGGTTTAESLHFFDAKEKLSTTSSSTSDSTDCASSRDPAPSCSEYFSPRIQGIIESRSEFVTALESEIEASKVHWSELQPGSGANGLAERNLELYRSLQRQYPNGFFHNWKDDRWAVGKKIAEGAQAEIFEMRFLLPEYAHQNGKLVMKVFKEGCSLEDLQKQWPPGMLRKATASTETPFYNGVRSSLGVAMLLKNGRLAFQMGRMWGDLRKLIDLKMLHNGNQAPPFSHFRPLFIMYDIAQGMRSLHKDNIVHRDLKASNVLIGPYGHDSIDDFDPTSNEHFYLKITDFESSVGVVGTGFWRAPEILRGLKKRDIPPSLFTEKSDIYSYAMTCYEILTGKIPFEGVPANNYDVVLKGARPKLPSGLNSWLEALICRCWEDDILKRPLFEEILEEFELNFLYLP